MVSIAPITGPLGTAWRNEECLVKAAASLAVGSLVFLSSEDADSPLVFDTATIAVAGDDNIHLIYGIVLSAASAANEKVRVLLKGVVKATTDGDTADADKLSAGAGVLVDADSVSGTPGKSQKVLAIALETDTGTTATVLFDGVNGFGTIANA